MASERRDDELYAYAYPMFLLREKVRVALLSGHFLEIIDKIQGT